MHGDPSKYRLRVTAGPSYDPSTHSLIHVNTPSATSISSPSINASINVRIKNFRGIPSSSPSASPYFAPGGPHASDLYSIAFSFSLPEGADPIPGNELLFGNDFDTPIRDSLPPGINTAMWIVSKFVDPGMAGDVNADKPYMYGPLLSSINVLRLDEPGAEVPGDEADERAAWSEGGSGAGEAYRNEHGVPSAGAARMRHFLADDKKKGFEFRPGTEYRCDFFNAYLDFNEFALKLPGFSMGIMQYWDGQPLRYVLKRKVSENVVDDEPLFVIVIALIPEEEAEEQEKKWAGSSESKADKSEEDTTAQGSTQQDDGGVD